MLEDTSIECKETRKCICSGSAGNVMSKAISAACPRQQRHIQEEILFSSAHKWSGSALDDEAMRGVFID